MIDLDLSLLDELAKNITPGVWEARSGDDSDIRYPTARNVAIFSDSDCDLHRLADFSNNGSCRPDWEQESNARFVAALVNAWPAIRKKLTTI